MVVEPPEQSGESVAVTGSVMVGTSSTVTVSGAPAAVPAQFASETLVTVYVVVRVGATETSIVLVGEFPGNVVVPSEYWKVHGPVPVKVNVMLVDCPLQMAIGPVTEAVGNPFTVRVTAVLELGQPVLVSVTKTVVVVATALENPSCTLVGATPVVSTVVSAASLYQV